MSVICSVVSDSLQHHGPYVACQAPPSMEFSRQEYWCGLTFPSLGYLPDPGVKPSLLHCRQILYGLIQRGINIICLPDLYLHFIYTVSLNLKTSHWWEIAKISFLRKLLKELSKIFLKKKKKRETYFYRWFYITSLLKSCVWLSVTLRNWQKKKNLNSLCGSFSLSLRGKGY